jgi:glutathionylspermidine synthase
MLLQELCVLPKLDDWFVQVCTWVVDQEYAGTVARADEKSIIDYESSVIPIRVVPE